MSKYPDWVNQHKTKGTSVKKVGNSYYLYKATSRRVEGKKYPQPVQSFIGTITRDGLVKTGIRKISTEKVMVHEYGFSRAMKSLLPEKFISDFRDDARGMLVFLHVVRQFSPASYLLRDVELPAVGELHASISAQTRKYERLAGISIKELLPLRGLYLVETKECDMLSRSTPEMDSLLDRLGVVIDAT